MAAVEEITVRRWRCESCRKSWSKRSAAMKHAVECHRDPATRACTTCVHNHRDDEGGFYCALDLLKLSTFDGVWIEVNAPIRRHCEAWEAS